MKPLVLTAVDSAQQSRVWSGSDTEAFVEQLNLMCLALGIARVKKLPTPYRIVGRGTRKGTMLCVPAAKSGTDYRGHIIGGRAVYVEAKRLTDSRLTFGSRLPEHQRTELENADREGQIAVLLVIAGDSLARPTIYAMPWRAVRARIAAGAKSLGIGDLAAWHVPNGTPYLRRWARPRPIQQPQEPVT